MKRRAQVRAFLDALRAGRYADGGYPRYFVMTDGGTLSYASARENLWEIARATRDAWQGHRTGWEFYGADINWEDPDLHCCHSGERIESAYAEPDEPTRLGES